ncbi:MAG: hypothetical protein A2Z20_04475 [Bdellovibrionales bacterium RBG_16_40_8]|nr:MAG: hypothetical protein A2Z20_04475 [Bdellovibrionales bacterium RBG_16_40_8]
MSTKFLVRVLSVISLVSVAAHAETNRFNDVLENPLVKSAVETSDMIAVEVYQTELNSCHANYVVLATYDGGNCSLPVAVDACSSVKNYSVGSMDCNAIVDAPSFAKDIKPLFTAKCAMCHGPGKAIKSDYSIYEFSVANKEILNNRVVVKKNMPTMVPFDQASRDLVAAWIAGGMLP